MTPPVPDGDHKGFLEALDEWIAWMDDETEKALRVLDVQEARAALLSPQPESAWDPGPPPF